MLTPQAGVQVDKFYAPVDWQYSFPEGYTRLEYLESSGTQYIDTNVQSSSDLIVDTKYYYESGYFFGYNGTIDGVNKSYGYPSNTNNSYLRIGGGYVFQNSEWGTNKWLKLHIENSRNNVTLNGVTFSNSGGNFGTHTFSNGGNITLGRYVDTNFVGKVKYFRIKQGNTLLRNFIPVKRNSDNKPGMYDLVNNVFYVNQGTGEFVMGPELYSNNSQIDIRQKNNTNFVEKYKFNANNELVWANPQLNLSGTVGYTKVGNPTITDNVVSGFSSVNYLTLGYIPNFTKLERFVKFTTNSVSVVQNIIGVTNYGGISIDGNGHIRTTIYTNSFKTMTLDTTVLSANTTYYYKDILENGIVKGYLFDSNKGLLDSKSEELGIDTTISYFVGNTNRHDRPFLGSIDLKETYIKVNDKLWFYGKNYTSENYAPVPAGLNYNNTTTPSIGYVNTQTQEFIPAPTDGIKYSQTRDIKVIPPEDNTITLLYGVASDFSKYALFGLLASVSSGTYDVYIDDVLYATSASNTLTDIDFSTLGAEYVSIGTCTTPESLVLHKIVIKPTMNGETITVFRTSRHSTQTGSNNIVNVLWGHLQLDNILSFCRFAHYNNSYCSNLYAITAKNNLLSLNNCATILGQNYDLNNRKNTKAEYIPNIVLNVSGTNLGGAFNTSGKLKRVNLKILKNITTSDSSYAFQGSNIEQINIDGIVNITSTTTNQTVLCNTYKLKLIPNINISNISNSNPYISNAKELYPSLIKCSSSNVTIFRTPGTSTYPMRGLRGLKVSNEAPFTGTSPQINVSYTGLDRDVLVELFNSLPDVSEATDATTRAINITAASGNNLTKVGTPTIDENGVASGFSSANYLKISGELPNLSKDIEFITRISPNSPTANQYIFSWIVSNYQCGIYIDANRKIRVYFSRTGTTATELQVASNYTLPNNEFTYLKIVKKANNSIYLYYSTDGINWILDNQSSNINAGTINIASYFRIGVNASYTPGNVFTGSIDLENTYIKVDNNYIMKGYLLDSDRTIATNKGWTITG